jgi:methylase of polypeptide subunit release factors
MAVPGMFLARMLADCLQEPVDRPRKILDIAGGRGLYGIEFAKRNPRPEIFAVEWQRVLDVALGNAVKAGVSERSMPGDALSVEFGGGYDLALITNLAIFAQPLEKVKITASARRRPLAERQSRMMNKMRKNW